MEHVDTSYRVSEASWRSCGDSLRCVCDDSVKIRGTCGGDCGEVC